MKFTCTQENLNRGLLVVSHIAGRSATLPILNNVLIKVDSGFIKLSTTNLEKGVSATVRGRAEKGGEFTVQAKLLADYINLLPKENIELELEDQTLYIRSDNYKTYIKGVDSTDFPLIPDMAREESVTLKAKDFRKALAGVVFAAAMDESRPEISGIFFSFSGKTLTLVGTDSYRLAEAKISLAQEVSEKKLIVPLRTLQEVYRILTESSESEITLFVNENQILFKLNDEVELISRLVEGQYPDYQQIIPGESKTQAKVKVNEFLKVIKSASLFCKPGINDVKISFLKDKNEIVVTAVNSAVGENLVNLEAECSGQDNEVVFNYRYLLDGLNNLDKDEVQVEIISNSAPGVIRPVGDKNYLYIIMPIRQ